MMLIRKRNIASIVIIHPSFLIENILVRLIKMNIARILRRVGVYYNNTCRGKIDTFQKYLESYDDY